MSPGRPDSSRRRRPQQPCNSGPSGHGVPEQCEFLGEGRMKAVGYQISLPIDNVDSLSDFEAAKPEPQGRDVRVAVKAVSVNPVDTKVRKRAAPPAGDTKILGYDAAGVVDAVGPDVTLFHPGDEVFYAGSVLRQGT